MESLVGVEDCVAGFDYMFSWSRSRMYSSEFE